jgi:transposase
VIAALLYRLRSGRLSLHFSALDHNVKTPDFLAFLLELRRLTCRPIDLVCDRLNAHRSAVRQLKEQGADWLSVEWLPPYAPDLNPVEAVWNHTKYSDLANRVPDDAFHLCDLIGESLNDQHFRPPLLSPSSDELNWKPTSSAGVNKALIPHYGHSGGMSGCCQALMPPSTSSIWPWTCQASSLTR